MMGRADQPAYSQAKVTDDASYQVATPSRSRSAGIPFRNPVLDSSNGQVLQFADAQQRIATTNIIMAKIRDFLMEKGDNDRANEVDKKYIQRLT